MAIPDHVIFSHAELDLLERAGERVPARRRRAADAIAWAGVDRRVVPGNGSRAKRIAAESRQQRALADALMGHARVRRARRKEAA